MLVSEVPGFPWISQAPVSIRFPMLVSEVPGFPWISQAPVSIRFPMLVRVYLELEVGECLPQRVIKSHVNKFPHYVLPKVAYND